VGRTFFFFALFGPNFFLALGFFRDFSNLRNSSSSFKISLSVFVDTLGIGLSLNGIFFGFGLSSFLFFFDFLGRIFFSFFLRGPNFFLVLGFFRDFWDLSNSSFKVRLSDFSKTSGISCLCGIFCGFSFSFFFDSVRIFFFFDLFGPNLLCALGLFKDFSSLRNSSSSFKISSSVSADILGVICSFGGIFCGFVLWGFLPFFLPVLLLPFCFRPRPFFVFFFRFFFPFFRLYRLSVALLLTLTVAGFLKLGSLEKLSDSGAAVRSPSVSTTSRPFDRFANFSRSADRRVLFEIFPPMPFCRRLFIFFRRRRRFLFRLFRRRFFFRRFFFLRLFLLRFLRLRLLLRFRFLRFLLRRFSLRIRLEIRSTRPLLKTTL